MRKLSQIWFEIQEVLFPFIEKEIKEPLTKKLKQLISTNDFNHLYRKKYQLFNWLIAFL